MCPSAHALPIFKPEVSALSLLLNSLSVLSLTSDPPSYFQRISTVGLHNPRFFWVQSTVMRFPLYSNLAIATSPLFGLPVLRARRLSSDLFRCRVACPSTHAFASSTMCLSTSCQLLIQSKPPVIVCDSF